MYTAHRVPRNKVVRYAAQWTAMQTADYTVCSSIEQCRLTEHDIPPDKKV